MIPIYIKNEKKFKTITLTLKFKAPIEAERLTERSLLAKLLTKSTARFPSEQKLYDHLSDLYGAHLSSYVTKQKTAHVMTFSMEFIHDKFVDEPLFDACCQLLSDVIKNPDIREGAFDAQKVAQEKQLLAARFDAIKDNKAQASFQRMLQEMFQTSYRYPSIGIESHLPAVTPESLYAAYDSMLQDEKALYIIGDVTEDVRAKLEYYFDFLSNEAALEPLKLEPKDKPVYVTEYTHTSQARINMGMTVPVEYGTRDYFAFIVMNQIYGGDATSLLFMNIREKMSLAYQIHSQIDARLGLLYVVAGVQNATYQQAVDMILSQLEMMKEGQFSEELLAIAKKMLVSHRRENFDRPRGWIETSYASTFDAVKLSTDEWIKGIESVIKEEVMAIAAQVNVQTIYCLAEEVTA
ncbi:EF-P 5-aminopentanol modification-associated protein YfmF [Macrococcus bovicus]|uniref:Insulinase family protein n=1 Tax=Macrococcus bovicus TaxID=69968 RepID=A0A4R6BWZ2_9STAP|nr:pitrilysin family protein [Macrococcus bovicus]TDM12921.1 insulinase family protein [Macrococcus bovicus]